MGAFDLTIRKTRFHPYRVGVPADAAAASVRLLSHRFLFGSNLFGLCTRKGAALETYRERALGLMNAGTLPFYWGRYETRRGQGRPSKTSGRRPDGERTTGSRSKGTRYAGIRCAPTGSWSTTWTPFWGSSSTGSAGRSRRTGGLIDTWDVSTRR